MTRAPSRRTCAALAILAYLAVALLTFRNVLPAPATRLAYPAAIHGRSLLQRIDQQDKAMVIATMVRNADLLTSRPWDLFADAGQCYPMPRAYTLGEHMFGIGLLAALPYALSHDPILTFNTVLILTIWIPAITMFFLSLRFTRSPPAAFVAGLAFALVPARLIDPSHPYVHGDIWAPAVLLFLHRLFVSGRWRDALGLASFSSLQIFESLYPLLSTGIVASVYGLYLLARHHTGWRRVLPRLATALAVAGAAAWTLFAPYLETKARWNLLSGRTSILLEPGDFARGGDAFCGVLVLVLVAIAALDRLRGPRLVDGEDPRAAFALGGLLIAWIATGPTPLPGLGISIPSPFLLLRDVVPGLSAVRALSAVAVGTGIATSFLVGYGVLALVERLRPAPWAPILGAALCACALLSLRLLPPVAEFGFGRNFKLFTLDSRPPPETLELLRRTGRGPLVSYPLGLDDGSKRLDLAKSLFEASYDPRPMAACYNSFLAPVNTQVIGLAAQLPHAAATDALGALGFETLFVNRNRSGVRRAEAFAGILDADAGARRRLAPLGSTGVIDAYRILAPTEFTAEFRHLRPVPTNDVLEARGSPVEIDFTLSNDAPQTFRHPEPLAPSELLVRWQTPDGRVAYEGQTRALLPIALGVTGTLSIPVESGTPERPGIYTVSVSRTAAPEHVLARRKVRILPRRRRRAASLSPTGWFARRDPMG